MKYTKPQLVLSGSALHVIQAHVKGSFQIPDNTGSTTDLRPTNGAYEADE
ncbi:MAG: hypothetical protein ROO76_10025 [Terriglobia bacterium]|jgi:hypothetical protein|nr:hypothetical protein [Terriglobia bacterium]